MLPDQGSSTLKQRLLSAIPVSKTPQPGDAWPDYVAVCALSDADIPELIAWAKEWVRDEHFDEASERESWLPLHAWRALGALRAEAAVEPLLQMLNPLMDTDDDWFFQESPRVFAQIGPAAIDRLRSFALNAANGDSARVCAVGGLVGIAGRDPATRPAIVQFLIEQLEQCEPPDHFYNSSLLGGVLDLNAVEAAPALERAFSRNALDTAYAGDWPAVRQQLGVAGLGLPLPAEPMNSFPAIADAIVWHTLANKVFAGGELNEAALEEYLDRVVSDFEASPERDAFVATGEEPGWVRMFLHMAAIYCGKTVSTMAEDDVGELLYSLIPQKVSAEPSAAAGIVRELQAFWSFVGRRFGFPNAERILEHFDKTAEDELAAELGNPRNFGPAKSFMMTGRAAGFDMTDPEHIEAFRLHYNSLLNEAPRQRSASPAPRDSATRKQQRKERAKRLANWKKSKKRR